MIPCCHSSGAASHKVAKTDHFEWLFHPKLCRPLKKEPRIFEKVLLYDGNFDRIFDYVRVTFVVDSVRSIKEILLRVDAAPDYEFVRLKNKFAASFDSAKSGGYRDYQALVRFKEGTPWIWELQIQPRAINELKTGLSGPVANAKGGLTGHGVYKAHRAVQESRRRSSEKKAALRRDAELLSTGSFAKNG